MISRIEPQILGGLFFYKDVVPERIEPIRVELRERLFEYEPLVHDQTLKTIPVTDHDICEENWFYTKGEDQSNWDYLNIHREDNRQYYVVCTRGLTGLVEEELSE